MSAAAVIGMDPIVMWSLAIVVWNQDTKASALDAVLLKGTNIVLERILRERAAALLREICS